ncbi:MAG: sensor domain-containing diguanylate cyclase [Defluviitaleaceae bacterium]|nr:sensor domain-containing diguanylate cyclase [Defluviitaleaceae bacterium]
MALYAAFPDYNPSEMTMDMDTDTLTISLLVMGILFVFAGFILGRFKNINKNTVKSPLLWITSFILPAISFALLIWISRYLPPVSVFVSIFFIFLFNTLTFFIHDSLSAAYEDKLKSATQMAERMQIILDSSPLACALVDEKFNIIEINKRTLELFGITESDEFISNHLKFSFDIQHGGVSASEKFKEVIATAFKNGSAVCEWIHCTPDGASIPCELTLERICLSEKNIVIRYIHDLRKIRTLETAKADMEKLAFSDWLTGLYNRRYFMDTAETSLQNCKKQDQDFSIIMLDIDHFKCVNDKYGHNIGDEVLKIFAKRIKQVLRRDAVAARYGGEEFIIMLPKANKENAMNTALRIHENIIKLPFVTNELVIPVTASVGVAAKTEGVLTLQEIINTADAAVYTAKNDGRNRVVCATL